MFSQAAIDRSDLAYADNSQGAPTRVTRLRLTNFRSYEFADIHCDGRPVVFYGANGAGKTNILEALSLLGPGRGVRSARLNELPRIGGPGDWAVAARVHDGEDERRLGVGVTAEKPDRRVCRMDDRPASGPGALAALVRFIWLTPAQDRLFVEGAGERRRFLDRMALAHDAAHGASASAYEQAMRQRQRLLDSGSGDKRWLDALEMQMAEAGVAIAAARRETAAMIAGVSVADGASPFPAADIALAGELETALAEQKPIDVEEDFARELRDRRSLDADAGRALYGPHRSDMVVTHRAHGRAARLCSTGEQKALLIGLVLSNARVLASRPGAAPVVMLLDEIAAHLDGERRAALFTIIDDLGFHAFMTGTDKSLFEAMGAKAQIFEAHGAGVNETTFTE